MRHHTTSLWPIFIFCAQEGKDISDLPEAKQKSEQPGYNVKGQESHSQRDIDIQSGSAVFPHLPGQQTEGCTSEQDSQYYLQTYRHRIPPFLSSPCWAWTWLWPFVSCQAFACSYSSSGGASSVTARSRSCTAPGSYSMVDKDPVEPIQVAFCLPVCIWDRSHDVAERTLHLCPQRYMPNQRQKLSPGTGKTRQWIQLVRPGF